MLFLLVFACTKETTQQGTSESEGAKGFFLTYLEDGVDVTIIQHQLESPDSTTFEFRTTPANGQIPWPVRRLITLSATQIGMLDLAEGLNQIVGVDDQRFVFSSQVKDRVREGAIKEVAINQELDIETILSLSPDVVLTSQFPDGSDKQAAMLLQIGVPVLPIVEWQETDPLGRAAWSEVIGAILNHSNLVSEKLSDIEAAYHELAVLTEEVPDRPMVLTGSPFRGTWHVPAGQSFLATMIRDAGGQTGWETEQGTGSIPLDPESIYPIGMQADYWIHPGVYLTMEELSGAFPEYGNFPTVRTGQVFNYYLQSLPDGANAYWEEGTVRPDLVLQDLVSIFHPELAPTSSFTYYHPLP